MFILHDYFGENFTKKKKKNYNIIFSINQQKLIIILTTIEERAMQASKSDIRRQATRN